MAFTRAPVRPGDPRAADPRLLDLQVDDPADAAALLVGLPYDGAVLGRRGCREGPAGIRDALRWLGTDRPDRPGDGPLRLPWHDLGDVEGMEGKPRMVHERVHAALAPVFARRLPLVVLGGDNSLSHPVASALSDGLGATEGKVGLVVVDAHYDMRDYVDEPTSGTPFRRVLTELPGRPVLGRNLVEVGIRPLANAAGLALFAREHGVHIAPRDEVRRRGGAAVAKDALKRALDGVDHLWLSVDIDGLDQSIAAGCSAPSPDGLLLHEVLPIVAACAAEPRCRGMEVMETAPGLDPTGNTARTAAAIVGHFLSALG